MTDRHVVPAGDGWRVEKEHAKRPSAKAATAAEAVSRATQIVSNEGGGRVVIHDRDGTVSENRDVTAGTRAQADASDAAPTMNGSEAGTATSGDSRVERTSAEHTHRGGVADGEHPRGRHAAHRAAHRNSLHLDLPFVGSVALPPPDQLAYLGGITTLVAVGILEWPIAALLGAGHLLAATRNSKILADFGEALEEA